jgi:hypothetical protein
LREALEESCRMQPWKEAPSPKIDSGEHEESLRQDVEVQKVQFVGIEKIGVPYRVHALKVDFNPTLMVPLPGNRWAVRANEFYFQENRPLQSRLLWELVSEEGPIHFDYAVQRLASAWGLKRKGLKIVQAVREALNLLVKNHEVTVKDSFIWPTELQAVQVRVPVAGVPESKRILEHIPPEEIEAAMKQIAQYALGISPESLMVETAKVFGFNHLGGKSKDIVYEVYKRLLWEKKLVCTNDIVTVA